MYIHIYIYIYIYTHTYMDLDIDNIIFMCIYIYIYKGCPGPLYLTGFASIFSARFLPTDRAEDKQTTEILDSCSCRSQRLRRKRTSSVLGRPSR